MHCNWLIMCVRYLLICRFPLHLFFFPWIFWLKKLNHLSIIYQSLFKLNHLSTCSLHSVDFAAVILVVSFNVLSLFILFPINRGGLFKFRFNIFICLHYKVFQCFWQDYFIVICELLSEINIVWLFIFFLRFQS